MPTTPKDEPFLNRWSRVKRQGEPAVAEPDPPATPPEEEPLSDAELLEKLGLPDPGTLVAGDDVRGFLSDQVPEHLRRIALRFLWRSNPLLANVDGLVDYGEDFTDAATVIENLQTVYQVGKGAAWKARAELDALAAAAEERPEPPDDAAGEPDAGVAPEQPEPDDAIEDATTETVAAFQPPDDPPAAEAARPRPMRFAFD